jgi:hypothetical protein
MRAARVKRPQAVLTRRWCLNGPGPTAEAVRIGAAAR